MLTRFVYICIKGTDVSLLCSIYFLSQTLISAIMGPLIAAFGNYTIMAAGCLFGLAGCAQMVFYFPRMD